MTSLKRSIVWDVVYAEFLDGRHVPDAVAVELLRQPGHTTKGTLTIVDIMRADAARRLVTADADAEGGAK